MDDFEGFLRLRFSAIEFVNQFGLVNIPSLLYLICVCALHISISRPHYVIPSGTSRRRSNRCTRRLRPVAFALLSLGRVSITTCAVYDHSSRGTHPVNPWSLSYPALPARSQRSVSPGRLCRSSRCRRTVHTTRAEFSLREYVLLSARNTWQVQREQRLQEQERYGEACLMSHLLPD